MSAHLSVYPSVCTVRVSALFNVYMSVYASVYTFECPSYFLSIWLQSMNDHVFSSVCLSICLHLYLFYYLSVNTVRVSTLFIRLIMHLSTPTSVLLTVYPSVKKHKCPFVYSAICLHSRQAFLSN
jgi:hypothetical protein